MRIVPWSLSRFLVLALLLVPLRAGAWTEARPSGLVTELAIDRDGGATITMRVRWRILAGRLHQFDLAELPPDLSLLEASAVDASGETVAIATRSPAPGRLEVSLGEEHGGVRRGMVDVVLRYTSSLRVQGAIQRAGADAVLEISTVPWERGLEAAEIRLALPSSVRRAQWIADDTPGVDATTTTELSRDIVHALRRHVPAGTRWTARIAADANLFPWLSTGLPRARHAAHHASRRWTPALVLGSSLCVVLLAAGLLLARRVRRPWLTLPAALAWLPALLVVLGAAAQATVLLEVPHALTTGTALLLLAVALRMPRPRALVLVDPAAPVHHVTERDLLARARSSSNGRLALLTTLVALAAVALAVLAARRQGLVLGVVALDLGLLALALPCLRHQTAAPHDARVLRPVAHAVQRLVRTGCARIAWRVRGTGSATGSVRFRLVPRPGWRLARGVHSLEWAVAMHPGTLGWHPIVVFLFRFVPGSPLERRARLLATQAGALQTSPDGDRMAFVAEWVGPERDAVVTALRPMLDEIFVRAPAAARLGHVAFTDSPEVPAP